MAVHVLPSSLVTSAPEGPTASHDPGVSGTGAMTDRKPPSPVTGVHVAPPSMVAAALVTASRAFSPFPPTVRPRRASRNAIEKIPVAAAAATGVSAIVHVAP